MLQSPLDLCSWPLGLSTSPTCVFLCPPGHLQWHSTRSNMLPTRASSMATPTRAHIFAVWTAAAATATAAFVAAAAATPAAGGLCPLPTPLGQQRQSVVCADPRLTVVAASFRSRLLKSPTSSATMLEFAATRQQSSKNGLSREPYCH